MNKSNHVIRTACENCGTTLHAVVAIYGADKIGGLC